jgi:translation initiation factor 3 subunit L
MSLANRLPYANGASGRGLAHDESDDEEEAMVNDYKEQVQTQFDDDMTVLDQGISISQSQTDDIQSRLQSAAMQLEYGASLETKFASYDNYCSLFHFILNSDGPVDLEVPSVF